MIINLILIKGYSEGRFDRRINVYCKDHMIKTEMAK